VKTLTVIDCRTNSRSTITFEPLKPTLANWLEVYGLKAVGASLVEREKRMFEGGEDCGVGRE